MNYIECEDKHEKIKIDMKERIKNLCNKDIEHHHINKEKIEKIELRYDSLEKVVDNKINWKQFWAILTIFVAICIATTGFFYTDSKETKLLMNERYEKIVEQQTESNKQLAQAINNLRVDILLKTTQNTEQINALKKEIEHLHK